MKRWIEYGLNLCGVEYVENEGFAQDRLAFLINGLCVSLSSLLYWVSVMDIDHSVSPYEALKEEPLLLPFLLLLLPFFCLG